MDLNSIGSPTYVAVRQQDIDFTASAVVSLDASAGNAEAGISVYMDVASHYDFFLDESGDGSQCVVLRYQLNSISGERKLPLDIKSGTPVSLTVKGTADRYDFSCEIDGMTHSLGQLDTRYLSTETAGGFTGVTIGLFAVGDGTALVRSFNYKPE